MDGDNVKNADVGRRVLLRNGDEECDFSDERGKPWTLGEEVAGCLEPLHRPNDKDVEEMVSRPGQECDAREREMA